MKKKVLLSTITMLTVLAMLTVSPVQAKVYSAHADNLNCHMDVIVDTTADTLKVKWWDVNAGMKYFYWGSYIHIWDDDGQIYWYDAPLGFHIAPKGELTFDYAKTYVNVHAEVRWCYQIYGHFWGFSITVRCDLYVGSGGGGGCPILSVWNGTDYFEEGLLDIHNIEGEDVVYQHTLVSTPQRENGAYLMRLTEHPQTHSYIDHVKLYAMLEDGTMKELPLIWAWHSEDGNVLPRLLHSDDWKADTLGADHNDGVSQSIDLKFAAQSPNLEIIGFVFEIEGNNMVFKI